MERVSKWLDAQFSRAAGESEDHGVPTYLVRGERAISPCSEVGRGGKRTKVEPMSTSMLKDLREESVFKLVLFHLNPSQNFSEGTMTLPRRNIK